MGAIAAATAGPTAAATAGPIAAAVAGAMTDSENVSQSRYSKLISKKNYLPAFAAITSTSYIAALAKSSAVQLELSVTR